ncbi:protein THYLAKOID FORMATION1 chloroplastic-like, partial [Trifolium medium]|nr:protein THYLAKOID FORMATION1 chloroplastic-like [Trifolium medium]
MAALTSLSFSATTQCSQRKSTLPSSTRFLASSSDIFGIRIDSSYYHHVGVRAANSSSKMVIQCMSSVT